MREKRRAVYDELKKREGWWVQWRGAEIYCNNTFTYHPSEKKEDGSPAVDKRGEWFKHTDYSKVIADEGSREAGGPSRSTSPGAVQPPGGEPPGGVPMQTA